MVLIAQHLCFEGTRILLFLLVGGFQKTVAGDGASRVPKVEVEERRSSNHTQDVQVYGRDSAPDRLDFVPRVVKQRVASVRPFSPCVKRAAIAALLAQIMQHRVRNAVVIPLHEHSNLRAFRMR